MIRKLTIIPLFTILVALGACELYPQDKFEANYAVESYLVANRPLPQVRVSRTIPVDEEYQFRDAAINNAGVEVRLLNHSGGIEQQFFYSRTSDGVYQTPSTHKVLPEREYQLHVTFSNTEDTVTSTTFVPGQFSTYDETVVDSIAYQDPRQVIINTTRSNYPGRQSFFIFTVEAARPDSANLTPFYADQLENPDADIESFYKNSSGIINEKNYEVNEDNTLTLRLPWLSVAFYGNNFIIANAIDDNMYDFYRSEEVQTGGSTMPPGEIQNLIYNVDGGIGIFGSMASDTVLVYIRRNQN